MPDEFEPFKSTTVCVSLKCDIEEHPPTNEWYIYQGVVKFANY